MSDMIPAVDSLQKLIAAEPLPTLPGWNQKWNLYDYSKELEQFHRHLLDYIRRLMARVNGTNIINEISNITNIFNIIANGIGDWRYHAATHKFQVKRYTGDISKGEALVLGDWEDAVPDQPVSVTEVNQYQYDTSSHKFQVKTQAFYALESSAVSGWGDVYTAQSVTNLTDWHYDASTHKFRYKTQADYVLEKATASGYTDAPADQPVTVTNLTEWHYDKATHKFRYKTQADYVLESAAVSAYTDAPSDQPVAISKSIEDVEYSTSTHILSQDYLPNVYVLEFGTEATDETITTFVNCGS